MANPAYIKYPNGGKFTYGPNHTEYQTSAQTRNGYVKQSGIEVFFSPIGVARLTPINSKGAPSNGFIEIPNDPAIIEQVINVLKEISK